MTSPHPLPALPIAAEHRYSIAYTVTAATHLDAITAAVGMLRKDVHLRGVNDVRRVTHVHWRVSLNVAEEC